MVASFATEMSSVDPLVRPAASRHLWVAVRVEREKGQVVPHDASRILTEVSNTYGFESTTAVGTHAIMLPLPEPVEGYLPTLRRLGHRALADLEARIDLGCWIGLGGVRETSEALAASSAEALEGINIARRIWPQPRAVLYGDVLPFVALAADRATCTRMARVLVPIERYDRRRRTSLQQTLDCLSDQNWSVAATARAMRIHRHTVEYRLKSVEDLLCISLNDPYHRATIEFALVARRLLRPR